MFLNAKPTFFDVFTNTAWALVSIMVMLATIAGHVTAPIASAVVALVWVHLQIIRIGVITYLRWMSIPKSTGKQGNGDKDVDIGR
jgi:hypothetical protein